MSKNVDERIVSMQFDNKEFEKNVSVTMATLERLKQTLQLENASRGLENVNKAARNVNLDNVTNSAQAASDSFSALDVAAGIALYKISEKAASLGQTIIKNIVDPIKNGGLTRALNIEQASFQLEGLGISKSNDAVSYYEEVMDAVLGTAYSYDVAAKAASQLAASNIGVTVSEKKLADGSKQTTKVMNGDMTEAIMAMAGVASMTGADFQSISDIFTRVAGQGRLMANDLNSLASRGLNAAATLADALGVTEAEVRSMVSKGQIDFATFSKAMSDAYGDHAKDSTKMFTGAMEDVKAALARIGADFWGPALESARDALNAFTPLVDAFHDKISGGITATTNILENFSNKLQAVFTIGSYSLNSGSKSIALAGEAINRVFDALDEEYPDLKKKVAELNGMTEEAYIDNIKEGKIALFELQNDLHKLGKQSKNSAKDIKNFDTAISDVRDSTRDTIVKISDALGMSGDAVNLVMERFNKAFNNIDGNISKKGKPAFEVLAKTLGVSADSMDDLQKKIDDGTIGWTDMYNAMSKVADQGYITNKQFNEFFLRTRTDKILNNKTILDAVNSAYSVFDGIQSAIVLLRKLGGTLLKVFNPVFKVILAGTGSVIKVLARFMDNFSDFVDSISTEGVGKRVGKVMEFIADALTITDEELDWVNDKFRSLFSIFTGINRIGEHVASGFERIGKAVAKIFEGRDFKIFNLFSDAFAKLKDTITGNSLFQRALDGMATLIEKLSEGVAKLIEAFGESEVGAKVIGTIESLSNDMYTAGVNIMDGLIHGIEDGAPTILSLLKSIATKMVEDFKAVLGIHSPSKVFMGIGGFIILGLCKGLANGETSIVGILKAMAQNMVDVFGDLDVGSLMAAGITGGLIVGFMELLKVVEKISGPITSISTILGSANKVLKTFTEELPAIFTKAKWNMSAYAMKTFAEAIAVVAASLGALALVAEKHPQGLHEAEFAMAAMASLMVVLLFLASKLDGFSLEEKKVKSAALTIAIIAAAMYLLAKSVKTLAKVNVEGVAKSITLMVGLIFALKAFATAMSSVAPMQSKVWELAALVVGFGTAMMLIAMSMKKIAKIKMEDLLKSMFVIAAIESLMIILMKSTQAEGKAATSAAATMLGFAGSMYILAMAIKKMAKIKFTDLMIAAGVLTVMGSVMISLLWLSNYLSANLSVTGGGAAKAALMFIGFASSLLLLGFALQIFGGLDKAKLKRASGALYTITVCCSILMVASKFAGKNAAKAGVLLAALGSAVLLLATSMLLLSLVDSKKLLGVTASVGVIIAALSGAMIAMSYIKMENKSVAMMSLFVFALITVIGGLVALSLMKPEKVVLSTIAIGGCLLALSAVMKTLSSIQISAASIGKMALIAGVFTAMGAIMAIVSNYVDDGDKALKVMAGVSLMAVSLSITLGILSAVGAVAPAALVGIGLLLTEVTALGAFIVAIGWLFDKLPALETNLDRGLAILQKVGEGLGKVIGGFISGITSGLDVAGDNIRVFSDKITPFIEAMSDINSTAFSNIKSLAGALNELSKVNFELLAGDRFKSFMEHAEDLGAAVRNFAMQLVDVNVNDAHKGAKTLTYLADASSNIPSTIGAGKIETFKSFITSMGEAISEFISKLGKNSGIDNGALDNAKKAVNMLSTITEILNNIPRSGGEIQYWAGTRDISKFFDDLESLAPTMNSLASELAGFDGSAKNAVQNAVDIINEMVTVANSLPASDGMFQAFTGSKDIEEFLRKLSNLAPVLIDFSNQIGSNNISKENIQVAADCINILSTAAASIQNGKGGLSAESGNSVATFTTMIPKLGAAIGSFIKSVPAFSADAVTTATDCIKKLADLATLNIKKSTFVDFANGVKEFVEKIANIDPDSVTAAIQNVNKILDSMKSFAADNVKSATESFGNAMKGLGNSGVSAMSKTISSKKSVSTVKTAVNSLIGNVISAIQSNELKSKFEAVGSFFVDGLKNGIVNNAAKVYTAAKEMAESGVRGAKEGADEHSPSKATYIVGDFMVQGLVNALDDGADSAYDAAYSLSEKATTGFSKAIAAISDLVDTDMNFSPTITPVLDLSEVENSAGNIGAILNDNNKLGLLSSISGINPNAAINSRRDQTNELVSSIKEMRRDLNNVMNQNGTKPIEITVPLSVDGRAFARATANYTQDAINTRQARADRLVGVI